jgi:hypothetical protein
MDKKKIALAMIFAGLASSGAWAQAQQEPPAPAKALGPPPQITPGQTQLAAKSQFEALDADRDQALSSREFMGPRWAAWSRWSKEGVMGPAECAKAEQESRAGEADPMDPAQVCSILGSGALSWEAFASPSWEFFQAADANADGALSLAEFSAWGPGPKRAPPRPRPSAATNARIQADLARSNAAVKSLGAQGAKEVGAAKPGDAPGEAAERSRLDEVSDRIRGWLR